MAEDEATPAPAAGKAAGKAAGRMLAIRLLIGLAQGLALFANHKFRTQESAVAFGVWEYTLWLIPIVALGAVGAVRRTTLIAWLAAATAITAVLGGYSAFVEKRFTEDMAWLPGFFFVAAALYILHHLILPADAERRWRASFTRYFDEAWKDAVRLALAALFVGVLWGLLWMGAELFQLIGLDFLRRLLQERWFDFVANTSFFALAIHITDIRVGLVQGARTLVLTLLSWLLVVPTLIAAGFLAALPFRGLKALLAANSASGTMLAVCAALIVLMNAAYQDGEQGEHPPPLLRWIARIAAVALVPLVGVAAYGVMLRIGQHGFTPSRIYACACLVVAACYAAGYAWAAVSRGPWMKRMETTNWVTAQIAVATILLLFSPVLDPARVSVGSQVARLEAGQIAPDAFDYVFLRFKSGRWGEEALRRLADRKDAGRGQQIAERAKIEMQALSAYDALPPAASERVNVFHATGRPIPPSFLTQGWPGDADPARDCAESKAGCQVLVLDGAPGQDPQVVVIGQMTRAVYGLRGGRWTSVGSLIGPVCPGDSASLSHGAFRVTPNAPHTEVEINGHSLTVVPDQRCPDVPKGAAGAQAAEEVTDVSLIKPAPPPPAPKR